MGDGVRTDRRRRLAAAVLAGALALASGCGGGAARPDARVRATLPLDRWSQARAIFRVKCAQCHTLADAGAHGRRSDLDSSSLVTSPRARAIARQAILHGGPGMPVWTEMMSPRDLGALTAYVVAVAGKRVPPRPPAPTTPVSLRRDRFTYARGLFDEICASCHRLADAGATIGAFDMDRSPLAESTQRPELARLVMEMGYHAGMPAFRHVLSEREFNALVAYISTVAGHPGATSPPPKGTR
jgi:mono/diheme cytochrome c family protein